MFGSKKSLLEKAIAGRIVDEKMSKRIDKLPDNYEVGTASDMQLIGQAIATLETFPEDHYGGPGAGLHALVALCQRVSTREARDAFSECVAPELIRLYDLAMDRPDPDTSLVMFMLKQLANFPSPGSTGRLTHAAHHPKLEDEYLWEVICSMFSHPDNPKGLEMALRVADPLPNKFASIAILDCMNAIAIDRGLDSHPFDSEEGTSRLKAWLSNRGEETFSYAVSATATLPFLTRPERSELFELAYQHTYKDVQLEASWAAAKIGEVSGIERLVDMSKNPHLSSKAVNYLTELGFEEAVPGEVREAGFMAMAEMSQWLQHPMELGRVPDTLELYDHRTLFWPPENRELPLWLFKYSYKDDDPNEPDDVGIGMVGSITFALFGEATAALSPEEVYGLHCCWELQNQNHADAPEERDGKVGWAMIQAGSR
ncbi:MAG: hypothetical protein AAF085_02540 [Planctomycetota bacterium]